MNLRKSKICYEYYFKFERRRIVFITLVLLALFAYGHHLIIGEKAMEDVSIMSLEKFIEVLGEIEDDQLKYSVAIKRLSAELKEETEFYQKEWRAGRPVHFLNGATLTRDAIAHCWSHMANLINKKARLLGIGFLVGTPQYEELLSFPRR